MNGNSRLFWSWVQFIVQRTVRVVSVVNVVRGPRISNGIVNILLHRARFVDSLFFGSPSSRRRGSVCLQQTSL